MAGTSSTADATIYSVAERAGVSIATVSRALQGSAKVSAATRDRVRRAADDLRYVPTAAARSLVVRRQEAYGLVLPHLSGPYYADLMMGFEQAASETGHSSVVLIAEPKSDVKSAVRQLAGRVDGLAFLARSSVPKTLIQRIAETRPVVVVAQGKVRGADCVTAESRSSATALTAHLIEHGRHRLVFVGDPRPSHDVGERHRGFLAGLAATGLRPALDPLRVELREPLGVAAAEQLLPHLDRIDGIVCANDELAVALMKHLQREGIRVPDDVAVVGWDNVMTARYISPGLTTVRQPVTELGRLAADRLRRRLEGEPPGAPVVLPTELVVLQSCGCDPPPPLGVVGPSRHPHR